MKKLDCFKSTIPCWFVLFAIVGPPVGAQQAIAFANADLITIRTPSHPGNDGRAVPVRAAPYPSTINVSGFEANATIDRITVTLLGLSHPTPDDIDILLVGPEGQNIVLFSDAGGGFVNPDVAVTVTLDDDALEPLPDDDAIVSGTFKPSNYEINEDDHPDVFPEPLDNNGIPVGPSPEPSLATRLAVFSLTHPNGDWQLFVVDDEVFDAGKIARGWSLTIKTRAQALPFRRGDANQDGAINLTDAVLTLTALFQGGAQPACADAADADDDGSVSLTDAVYTLNYLFRGGPTPPVPGPEECGMDPTKDDLPCDSFLSCRSGCPPGLTECGGVCVDTNFDRANCGGCGVACGDGETCSGSCQPVEPCVDCGEGQ